MDKAYVMHVAKKQMKITEDPWDNYLFYDSKYILPILCHAEELSIEQQVLVSHFLVHSCYDGTITQYNVKGRQSGGLSKKTSLITELVDYIKNDFDLNIFQSDSDGS